MIRLRSVAAAAGLVLVTFAIAGAGSAAATHTPGHIARTAAAISLGAAVSDQGSWTLEATVTDAAGAAVGGAPVEFIVVVEFLGTRPLKVATATTDAAGVARATYRPTWSGEHRVLARTTGADGAKVRSTEKVLEVTGARSPVEAQPRSLPITRAWATPVAVAVVLGVWGLLAAVFLAVVLGIRRAGRLHPPPGPVTLHSGPGARDP